MACRTKSTITDSNIKSQINQGPPVHTKETGHLKHQTAYRRTWFIIEN